MRSVNICLLRRGGGKSSTLSGTRFGIMILAGVPVVFSFAGWMDVLVGVNTVLYHLIDRLVCYYSSGQMVVGREGGWVRAHVESLDD